MKSSSFLLASFCSLLLAAPGSALTIDLRYDYDTTGFFAQPGAKEALRAVANYYEALINDSLLRIDNTEWPAGNTWTARFMHPTTGAETSITNLVVPADTLIVYVGGRPLGGAAGYGGPGGYGASYTTQNWLNRIKGRGQTGALAGTPTDFGPWGGSITFDPNFNWSFSTTGPVDSTISFVSVALHEFGHVLGIGTADSWMAKLTGGDTLFTGSASTAVYGANVPTQSDGSHWRDDQACTSPDGYNPSNPLNVLSKAHGSFNALHGYSQIALMDPSTCSAGPFLKVMTDLDLAGLRDIGWQIAPPARWQAVATNPASSPFTFSWPSTSGTTYQVQTSTTLTSWTTLTTVAGNGTVQNFTTPAPGTPRAFYRLNTAATAAHVDMAEVPAAASAEPRMASGCKMGTSYGQHE